MIVLGIETSCDETAAAVVKDNKEIKSNIIRSQLEEHRIYGGVVPEIAARSHVENINHIIKCAMNKANVNFKELSAIAATGGPGLIGGLIVGVMTAKAISLVHNIPFIAVNHLVGHALSIRLTNNMDFPYLLLLTSGGHCQLTIVFSPIKYKILGETIDDAIGEAFDKVAKILKLPYPGGPSLEKAAKTGNPERFNFPRPLINQKNNCNFSFSGLKTAVLHTVQNLDNLNKQDISDISSSFQAAIADVLIEKSNIALSKSLKENVIIKDIVLAGGVASNQYLRQKLNSFAKSKNINLCTPPTLLCTDNAAMIAWAGVECIKLGISSSFNFTPKPRWSLNTESLKCSE